MQISLGIVRRLRPSGLSGYMALASSMLSIILTLVLVVLVQKQATEYVQDSIGYGLGELAQHTADGLDRGMYERFREVKLLARRVQELDPTQAGPQRKRMLEDAAVSYAYYSWLGIAALDGTVLAAANGLLEGGNVAQRPWFGNALKGIHIGDVHEAVKLAKLIKTPAEQPLRLVDVAFPILDTAGKPRGVLGAHLSWQWARDIAHSVVMSLQAGRDVEVLITSANGVVVLGPSDLLGTTLSSPGLHNALNGRGVGFSLEKWDDGKEYLVGYRQTKGYEDYPGLGWVVLLRQESENAYAPVRRLGEYALWTGVSLALLFSLAGGLVANWITYPIKQLQEYADRIRLGEPATIAPATRAYDEVHSLSGALNMLLADLLRRSGQLEALNESLERRVEERTNLLTTALAAVRQNVMHIQTIIETAHDAFIGMDRDGFVTDWNMQAASLLGWTRNEAVGRSLAALVLPRRFQESFERTLHLLRATGQSHELSGRVERIVVHRDGNELPVEMSFGIAGQGEQHFVSIFLRDISLRKRVDQMKNELVATVSHELRTPLTSMRASLSLLTSGAAGELEGEARELAEIAHRHCERLVRLVSDMLDVEKLASGKPAVQRRPVHFLSVVTDALAAIRVQAEDAGITLVVAWDPALEALIVELDQDRITQVLLNLLSNAVKFAPRGSSVEVTGTDGEGKVMVSVADRGPGIAPEFRDRIFQRFAQADSEEGKKGSSGLGLAISRQIVVDHGGVLWYEDRSGGGVVFHVELPVTSVLAG